MRRPLLMYLLAYAIMRDNKKIFHEGGDVMVVVSLASAQEQLLKLIENVNSQDNEPVTITTQTGQNAVLLSESLWNSIQETLYLNSIPGLADSIIKASKEPIEDCVKYEGKL